MPPYTPGPRALLRLVALLAAIALTLVLVRHAPLPAALADALGALGPAAAAVIPALYVPWMLLGIPTAPLGLAAGFTLGSLGGGVVATTGCTAGACAAFLAARWLGRGAVERLATRVPGIDPVRRAVRARGFRIVVLLRLAPLMPVPFLNHVLGVSSVPLAKYFAATLLGTLPSAFVAASVGALVRAAGGHVGPDALRLHGPTLVAAVLASIAAGAFAVRILARELSAGAVRDGMRAGSRPDDAPRAAGAPYEAARSSSGPGAPGRAGARTTER